MALHRNRTRFFSLLVAAAAAMALISPTRDARADLGPFPTIQQGTGGAPTLAGEASAAVGQAALASVDLATGAARAGFTFQLLTARGQAQPSLSLRYDSNAGVGLAGIGEPQRNWQSNGLRGGAHGVARPTLLPKMRLAAKERAIHSACARISLNSK